MLINVSIFHAILMSLVYCFSCNTSVFMYVFHATLVSSGICFSCIVFSGIFLSCNTSVLRYLFFHA